ncbi:MAG: DUF370 domain-containing protein [Xylanivirga thermophila]|jgi:extracellular matrix regulatory protein B|uniref:extracellular matrix regulator RemB n=1 Tax=Xylanivirga thermophila TaxID=2496273 RepID=UPI001A938D26|nr:extracellular matrix/biofilm biosynthesis regulator RemA family protein [Xylanivirga thermophila]
MILHLGGDATVRTKDIIAIIDIDTMNFSPINKEFLQVAKQEGFIRKVSDDPPKTFIISEVDKKPVVFISPISSTTLLKRSDFIKNISGEKDLK